MESSRGPAALAPDKFATTRWTVVLAAAQTQASQHESALEDLCARYWLPLYWHVRRSGHNATEAQDLAQAFFLYLIERHVVAGADRRRGRFRTYLLTCLSNFLAGDHERATALKRGGAFQFVSLDELPPDSAGRLVAPAGWSPERAFDVSWAEAVVARVLRDLRAEAAARGRERWFDELEGFLDGRSAGSEGTAAPYREVSARLGVPEATIKTTVRRLRLRFRELIREEVARTVEDPADVDAELHHLYEMLLCHQQRA